MHYVWDSTGLGMVYQKTCVSEKPVYRLFLKYQIWAGPSIKIYMHMWLPLGVMGAPDLIQVLYWRWVQIITNMPTLLLIIEHVEGNLPLSSYYNMNFAFSSRPEQVLCTLRENDQKWSKMIEMKCFSELFIHTHEPRRESFCSRSGAIPKYLID